MFPPGLVRFRGRCAAVARPPITSRRPAFPARHQPVARLAIVPRRPSPSRPHAARAAIAPASRLAIIPRDPPPVAHAARRALPPPPRAALIPRPARAALIPRDPSRRALKPVLTSRPSVFASRAALASRPFASPRASAPRRHHLVRSLRRAQKSAFTPQRNKNPLFWHLRTAVRWRRRDIA